MQCETCPRGRDDCAPLQNVIADDSETPSFVCVGYNRPAGREVQGDRFTHCWRNHDGSVDERSHWDRRDMLDTVAVMVTALSIDENVKVGNGFTEQQMNEMDFVDGPPEPAQEAAE